MVGIKITNVVGPNGGNYDYKGIDMHKLVPGTFVYPTGTREFYAITEQEDFSDHPDVHIITEEEYAEVYNAEANREPAPNPIEEMQKQIDAMQLALMGMMDTGGNA